VENAGFPSFIAAWTIPLGGSVDRSSNHIDGARIRTKSVFLETGDPGQALLEFFERLGTGASHEPHERPDVKSLPLILISQLPRSGGSLLSQLLDGHPQLLVYPWEMTIGYPVKNDWPILDMRDTPDRLFAQLFDAELGYLARKGYRKRGKTKQKEKRLKFKYSPLDHYLSFVAALPQMRTQRAVLDTYFDTFFRSWRRDPNDALYVAGFVPRLASRPQSVACFFRDYPDGRLISIVRDPADWFASRRAHTKNGEVRYNDVREEMTLWNQMASLALTYRKEHGERFLLLSFKELVTDRDATMRRVAAWSGIDFDPALLNQTFDSKSIHPNTNFDDPVERLAEAVFERKQCLSEAERAQAYRLTEAWRGKLQQTGWAG
jgi:sulfotransferase family protein